MKNKRFASTLNRPDTDGAVLKKLHHAAYRCRDSEATRAFYEDFLGLELCEAKLITESKTGRPVQALHTFFRLDDGSFIAFFEVQGEPFEFREQDDYDLHIALEVDHDQLEPMMRKGKEAGIETRGISDHEVIDSIYFRDPNGYVVELAARRPNHDEDMDPRKNGARERLRDWQASKAGS
jgi:catechol 2,3-dioxygenase-like lactoylglutathione lyase family enzyme